MSGSPPPPPPPPPAPQSLRRRRRRRRPRPRGPSGRVLRPARAERRRQDHHHRDLRGPHGARRRRGRGPRPALGHATTASCASGSASRCRRPSSPRSSRCARRCGCSAASIRAAPTAGEVIDAGPARGEARRPRRAALRRPAAAAGAGLRAGRRPRAALPRRADHRARPAVAPPALGADRAASSAGGRSILLTTHYMDEAERLCDRVAIVDHGRVIAQGTPRELIASLGRGARPGVRGRRAAAARRRPPSRGVVGGVAAPAGGTAPGGSRSTELHRAVPALLGELRRAGRAAVRAPHPLRHARGRLRHAHRDGSSVTTEPPRLARPPARPAHPGAVPRVLSASPRRSSGCSSFPCCSPPGSASRSGTGRRSASRWRSWRAGRGRQRWPRGLAAADGLRLRMLERLGGGAGAPHRRRRARGRARRPASVEYRYDRERPDGRDGAPPGRRGAAARRGPRRPGRGRARRPSASPAPATSTSWSPACSA